MVLGDFGGHQSNGFGSCYNKTVDKPQHFRMKPKQVPKEAPETWGFGPADEKTPEYNRSARFSCRAADHDDMLTGYKSGAAYGSNLPEKLSKRVITRPPTVLVAHQVIGGAPGSSDNFASKPIVVGKKPIQGAAQRTHANIRDPSQMPALHHVQGKREATFSVLSRPTMGNPDMYQRESKGKRQSQQRTRLTTGKNELLRWEV